MPVHTLVAMIGQEQSRDCSNMAAVNGITAYRECYYDSYDESLVVVVVAGVSFHSPRESWVHSLLWDACPPQSPPLANLECIHCCGRPQSLPRLLRAACPHGIKALPARMLRAFTAAGSLPELAATIKLQR